MTEKKYNKSSGRIFLAWAHSKTEPNFGDELSPYILSKITGMNIVHIPVLNNRIHLLILIAKRLLTFKINEGWDFVRLFCGKKFYIFLGSIIQFYKLNGGIVWGAGLIDDNYTTGKHIYYAVRGPKTKALLEKNGNRVPEVFGDPALFLPKIYDKPVAIKSKVGVIPHIIHYDDLLSRQINCQMTVIDLRTQDIERVIDDIRSCELVISSSLHGLIVAHSYGIPALWVELGSSKLMGNNVKFFDYFESIQLSAYNQISIDLYDLDNLKTIEILFENYWNNALPIKGNLDNVFDKFLLGAPPKIKKFIQF